MTRITFHGAAETVTGSKYLLEADGRRIMIDCGLFQGLKELRERNWTSLPFPPATVKSVVLTHAHLDHVGYLPRFVKDGFAGPTYCTPPTEDIAELVLLDSAKIQEEDAAYANRKGFSKHKPALPLYTKDDARRALKRLRTVRRGEWFCPAEPFWCRYHDVGHLLGASMIELEVRNSPDPLRILFSGDIGRYDAPLYFDPDNPPSCDYLICESTYGNRNHPTANVLDQLCEIVLETFDRKGVVLIASFAVGRAQQVIYLLKVLMAHKRIPEFPIYLDSPMAVAGMKIFQYYSSESDLIEGLSKSENFEFDLDHVRLARTSEESRRINNVGSPAVIIASSGMMTGGRILHHLRQRLDDDRNTVVLGGFMAEGTRGRALQDGARYLRLLGQEVPVRAKIAEMSGLSGHAGHSELLRWLEPLAAPRRVFLTHGEVPAARALADDLQRLRGWSTVIPKMGESFDLGAAT
jgi:metallo-beta-lactamase family protein